MLIKIRKKIRQFSFFPLASRYWRRWKDPNVWEGFSCPEEILFLRSQGRWEELSHAVCSSVFARVGSACHESRRVVLTGRPRVGKSEVAKCLARHFGFFVIPVDHLYPLWFDIKDPMERSHVRTKICGSLLKKAKVNVCLEGSEFCSANAARGWKNRYPLGFDSVERLREDVPLELVVLGNSECSIADKVAAIDRRAFFGREGVIERVSGEERLKRVEAVIKDSMMLKQLCASCDATYHEVSVRGFKESVQSIAGRIAAHRQ